MANLKDTTVNGTLNVTGATTLNTPLSIANGGTGATTVAQARNNLELLDYMYPIGSIYMSVNSTNPGAVFGGEWVPWGAGRVPVGVDTSQSYCDTVEETGGSPDAIIPYHYHSVSAVSIASSGTHNHQVICSLDNGSTQSGSGNDYVYKNNSGGSRMLTETSGGHPHTVPAHNTNYAGTSGNTTNANLQPYITCYMWKRTA